MKTEPKYNLVSRKSYIGNAFVSEDFWLCKGRYIDSTEVFPMLLTDYPSVGRETECKADGSVTLINVKIISITPDSVVLVMKVGE